MPKKKIPKEMVAVTTKIPKPMYDALLKYVNENMHTSLGELIRDILREWLERREAMKF